MTNYVSQTYRWYDHNQEMNESLAFSFELIELLLRFRYDICKHKVLLSGLGSLTTTKTPFQNQGTEKLNMVCKKLLK